MRKTEIILICVIIGIASGMLYYLQAFPPLTAEKIFLGFILELPFCLYLWAYYSNPNRNYALY